MPDDYPTVQFPDASAFEHWLQKHGDSAKGVWLKMAKKAAPFTTITYPEAVEVALCFGWIDGQLRRIDEHSFVQKFTPRRKGSVWSQVNCRKIESLIAAGRMRAAGLAAVAEAKQNGRWAAAYSASVEPPDWTEALASNKVARQAWSVLDARNRAAILFRIQSVRRAETRARKIAEFTAMLEQGRTPLQCL